MRFEFVTVYRREKDVLLTWELATRLRPVLFDNDNEMDAEDIWNMISIGFERRGGIELDDNDKAFQRVLAAFSLDLPDDTNEPRHVVDEWCDALLSAPSFIEHLVKFEYPLLHAELEEWGREIFDLEMKLRRAISVVYLHAYQSEPYNLLCDEKTNTTKPDDAEQMARKVENEFFFLNFSQYAALNERPEIKLETVLGALRNRQSYEELCVEISRVPVGDGADADFLSRLKELVGSVDSIRNCVAHNRRPSQKVVNNYTRASPQLHAVLDAFLQKRQPLPFEEIDEMPGETEAREAVERALKNAEWEQGEVHSVWVDTPQLAALRSRAPLALLTKSVNYLSFKYPVACCGDSLFAFRIRSIHRPQPRRVATPPRKFSRCCLA